MNVPYPLVCAAVGVAVGAIPAFFHGPIPYKFAVLGLHGTTAVWAFYVARMLIGVLVGMTAWPRPWYVRGPLCGFLVMLPVGIVAVATPGCGGT